LASPAGIVAAGGRGERVRVPDVPPKQFRSLGGRTLLQRSIDLLVESGCDPVVVVVPEDTDASLIPAGVVARPAGETRQASVWSGLQTIESDRVVIHDGARPLASISLVRRVLEALSHHDGAVAAVPLDETLKLVSGEEVVTTIDRSGLWAIQTPQAFRTVVLRDAHERALADDYLATDDAGLVERYGGRVCVVRGARTNIKLTYPEDFELAAALLEAGPT
jgi:2-C-methyl-D-erythritol 4-phosphate cytidylyltransferase